MAKLQLNDPAESALVNNKFLGRDVNDTMTGILTLNNTVDVNSGALITNPQRYINEVADADGTAGEGDSTRKDYSSNNYVTNGDNRKAAIGKLDAQAKVNADNITTNTTSILTNTILMVATESIAASGTISGVTGRLVQYRKVEGDSGAQDASTTPFTAAQVFDHGTTIHIVGTSDTNTLKLDYNDANYGLLSNGPITLKRGSSITLIYDNDTLRYQEISRTP